VTVLQRGERMLTHFDPDLVGWLIESFQAVGIDVRTGSTVEAIESTGTGYRVSARMGGQSVAIEAGLIVHAAGRVPNLDGLDLDRAGVAVEKGRLLLNEHMQSVSDPVCGG
jgi:glutathione reductase (NADPH)